MYECFYIYVSFSFSHKKAMLGPQFFTFFTLLWLIFFAKTYYLLLTGRLGFRRFGFRFRLRCVCLAGVAFAFFECVITPFSLHAHLSNYLFQIDRSIDRLARCTRVYFDVSRRDCGLGFASPNQFIDYSTGLR